MEIMSVQSDEGKSAKSEDGVEVISEVKDVQKDSSGVSITVDVFKKPQLIIGPRRGKAVGKVRNLEAKPQAQSSETDESTAVSDKPTDSIISERVETDTGTNIVNNSETKTHNLVSPAQKIKENLIPLPYKEPKWSGIPNDTYGFEVLKSGKILENVDLSSKSFYVFGRLSTCDIHMAHPTISRYHAVLQYRSQENESSGVGFYIYDLGSTHGTFLNKNKIKSNMYVRVQVGHVLKLGCSSRLFILQGPEKDMEEESDLTVTQLKEKRQLELAARELEELETQRLEEEKAKQEEEQGIDWGMGEDADEETDLAENPFAATQNEELYINDPKKTLRGWFEREGYDLEYDVEEKGFGQFLCRVELPIENARGGTMTAEALVKGKKKEAVVQCALEACRILDRYGLLRQATHESKKRKAKDWEAEDYYDSDEDTFLDRTGTVEKKRQQRMRAAGKKAPGDVVETYDSLMEKHKKLLSELQDLEIQLQKVSRSIDSSTRNQENEDEEDALDAFMMKLSTPVSDKKLVLKIKSQIAALKQEEIHLRKLVNIARPANLPELHAPEEISASRTSVSIGRGAHPLVGTRRKPTSSMKKKICTESATPNSQQQFEEEEEEEENEEEDNIVEKNIIPSASVKEIENTPLSGNDREMERQDKTHEKGKEVMDTDKVESQDIKKCITNKQRTKVFGPAMFPPPELRGEITANFNSRESGVTETEVIVTEAEREAERKKNRNKRRIQQRNEKAMRHKIDYDPSDPDYSVWVPPEGQTGDGRTKLNDKYGY